MFQKNKLGFSPSFFIYVVDNYIFKVYNLYIERN